MPRRPPAIRRRRRGADRRMRCCRAPLKRRETRLRPPRSPRRHRRPSHAQRWRHAQRRGHPHPAPS
jgi:hypothetical protein